MSTRDLAKTLLNAADAPNGTPEWVRELMRDAAAPPIARPLSHWDESDGPATWWCWQDLGWLGEPAWIGTPNDGDWPNYHTHWTPHPPMPTRPAA